MTEGEKEHFAYGFYVGALVIAAIVVVCELAGYGRPSCTWY